MTTVITYHFVANTRFDDQTMMWYPRVTEYCNEQIVRTLEFDYPCQEQELALMVAQNLRDEERAMAEKSTQAFMDEIHKRVERPQKGNTMNKIKTLVEKIVEEGGMSYNQHLIIRDLCVFILELDERVRVLEDRLSPPQGQTGTGLADDAP